LRKVSVFSTKFKSHGKDQMAFDMSRNELIEPTGALIPSSYSGLSLVLFPSISLFSRASGNSATRNDSAADSSASREPYRILMVDDEKDITMIFRSALERAGFKVEVFNNPVEALSHFKPDYYDLALLDVRMPQMSGFELYQEIMKQDKGIKACFISAFEVYKEELRKYAPDKDEECIIRKPLSTRDLVRIIKEELE
jgi:CheY-like chemotaxis protein